MTIRAPYVTPQKDILGPSLLSITTASLALTAVVAAVLPFNNSQAFGTPVQVQRSAPDQVHTDISKFTNPIPFAQTQWTSALPLNSLPTPPRVVPYNPNLYSVVAAAPFIPVQWAAALPLNSLPSPPRVIPYNPNLYSVAATAPFFQTDWRAAFNIPGASPKAQSSNQLIYSEVPFAQSDWPRTVAVRYNPPQAQHYNALVYSEVPNVPVDYNKPFGVANVPPNPVTPYYNLNLFGQTLVPLNVAFDVARAPNFVQPGSFYNLNLYGQAVVAAAPFSQLDWSKPSAPTSGQAGSFYNLNIYGQAAIAASPFSQSDWSKSSRTQIAVPQFAPTNINLFTNTVPFALYDWNKPSAYGPSASPFPQTSVALLTAIQAPPFVPVDYSKPYFPRNQIDATNPANPASFTNPQPIIPVDYNTTRQNPNFQIWAQAYNVNLFVPPAPVVDDTTRGSETILTDRRGAGPHFSRREFDEFLKAKRAAEAKARHLKKKPGAELRRAVEVAEEVHVKMGLLGDIAPSIEPLTEALFEAAGANVAQVAADAREAIRIAEALLAQMDEEREEEAVLMLLLTS